MRFLLSLLLSLVFFGTHADDGYRLWLKYDPIKNPALKAGYSKKLNSVFVQKTDETIAVALAELKYATRGMLGKEILETKTSASTLKLEISKLTDINPEAFEIKNIKNQIIVRGNTSKGVLYGVFELIRKMQLGESLENINVVSSPKIQLRMLNHWDNNNGTIERGYAGMSMWKWYELPERIDPRYIDYARANASIGINGTVLNNVNASARFITGEYLGKVKALADVYRPYGIKVYLSVNFASPKILGKLKTADPLDQEVQKWWKEKADEIYKVIPDFGGFLVKANSEGEPGPMDFGRTHKDGANMLAEALAPHGGLVIWRAFVYNFDPKGDRFAAAYNEFKKFDGEFLPNVIIQVKNGPIDFQVREPISPLFGAMEKTPVSIEFQLTQEYLGWATHWVYEAPMFEEVLKTDTFVKGKGSTVAKVIDGEVFKYPITSMVGVANTGSDRNWTGHPMAQANWYTMGRMAWNPEITSEKIADEWVKMTFRSDAKSTSAIKKLMMESREIYTNYTNPLGVHHVMGESHHFGPEPWVEKAPRPDWTALYYHRADSVGIGFDRTEKGSNSLAQYHPELRAKYSDIDKIQPEFLLWFHHAPWGKKLSTGRSVWDEMVNRYYEGVKSVEKMNSEWQGLRGKIDRETFENVESRLKTQLKEAYWWRDASVLYFQKFSKMPVSSPYQKPTRTFEELKQIVDVYHVK
ncbi:MAG: alpha-glucuronidase [Cytophagaceae bacterium]|nr:alpha-glucuronidase [Cytophagaceae bacterium]